MVSALIGFHQVVLRPSPTLGQVLFTFRQVAARFRLLCVPSYAAGFPEVVFSLWQALLAFRPGVLSPCLFLVSYTAVAPRPALLWTMSCLRVGRALRGPDYCLSGSSVGFSEVCSTFGSCLACFSGGRLNVRSTCSKLRRTLRGPDYFFHSCSEVRSILALVLLGVRQVVLRPSQVYTSYTAVSPRSALL